MKGLRVVLGVEMAAREVWAGPEVVFAVEAAGALALALVKMGVVPEAEGLAAASEAWVPGIVA